MSDVKPKDPSLLQSLIPVVFMVLMLFASVRLFGEDSSYGPNQIALILSAGVGILIGIYNGHNWKALEKAMVDGISLSMGAIFILLVVGCLIGTWILAGIVPTMIYYGLMILSPKFFYIACAVICAVVAVSTGSSWTTVSTVGIALIGIAGVLDLSLAVSAGAIISGAYFGDKLSPLSDTTNLAPAMAGTDLFTHIRHMLWTTIPSFVIACVLFFIIGITSSGTEAQGDLQGILDAMRSSFNLGWYLLIPPVLVLIMVRKKVPAFPALLIGSLIGGVFAMIFQQKAILSMIGETDLPYFVVLLKGVWTVLFGNFVANTGNEVLDNLLTRGGMGDMLNTIWLILSAMMLGAVLEKTGMLQRLAQTILSFARSTGSLIACTLFTSIGMNIIASDQYIAIVVPGRMFRAEFKNRKLHPKNLSRTLEDAGTLTSPLVPWNTCGVYMAQNLSVATFAYLPFCFFNLLNPVIAAIYGFTGFSIEKLDEEEAAGEALVPEVA